MDDENNLSNLIVTYNKIVKQLVENRNSSKSTQDMVSNWLNVSRKKLIEFENLKGIDIKLMCEYADIYGIEIKLNFIVT
jgi:hypothetical protein